MYKASEVEHCAPGQHGYPRASRLTSGKTSKGHFGTQSLGCAGQTVRPSLHSISQISAGRFETDLFHLLTFDFSEDSRISF
jgi:hypothetical protein